jgi:hypothetical protein
VPDRASDSWAGNESQLAGGAHTPSTRVTPTSADGGLARTASWCGCIPHHAWARRMWSLGGHLSGQNVISGLDAVKLLDPSVWVRQDLDAADGARQDRLLLPHAAEALRAPGRSRQHRNRPRAAVCR